MANHQFKTILIKIRFHEMVYIKGLRLRVFANRIEVDSIKMTHTKNAIQFRLTIFS